MKRPYVFRGYVTDIDNTVCWLHMRDVTVPSNPDEEWSVWRERVPADTQVGSYVTFTINPDEAGGEYVGAFTLTSDRWTAEELAAIHQRAEDRRERLGLPRTADAVDPHASSTGTPSPREEKSHLGDASAMAPEEKP